MAKKTTPADEPLPADPPKPLRLEWRSPAELAENPLNWRRHPEAQIAALSDVIAETGWAGACLFNERTGRLIDGHARRKVALEQGTPLVPVLVGSWDEATEKKILATLDPLAAMAECDEAALLALMGDVETNSAAVQAMLDAMTPDAEPLAEGWGETAETADSKDAIPGNVTLMLAMYCSELPEVEKLIAAVAQENERPADTIKRALYGLNS